MIKSISDNKNIGLNIIGGSLTPYINKNPNFLVLELDAEHLIPINIKSYYYDLVQANANGAPTWTLLHDYTTFYGMDDFSPDSIMKLAEKVRDDDTTAKKYLWNKRRQ